MQPTLELQTPEPYKPPPPVDEDSFFKEVGLGIAIAIGAIAFVIVVVRAWRDRRFARPAKLVDHELVTVAGIVRSTAKPLTAPLSGRECVVHRSRAYVLGDPGSSEGRSLFGAVPPQVVGEPVTFERAPFSIETKDGTIEIADDKLELDLVPRRVVPPQPTREREFLARFGWSDRHDKAGFDEIVIAANTKIAIRGMVRIEHDPHATDERGYRDAAPVRMRLVAPENSALTIVRVWD